MALVVSIGAVLVLFHSFSYSGEYFENNIKSPSPSPTVENMEQMYAIMKKYYKFIYLSVSFSISIFKYFQLLGIQAPKFIFIK